MKTSTKVFLLLSGIFMIIAGIYALCHPVATLLSMSVVLGIFMLIAGIGDIISYCSVRKVALGSGFMLFDGILTILVALLFLGNNYIVASALPVIFSIWFIVSGVEKIIHACDLKKLGAGKWWILLILGIICALIGLFSILRPLVALLAMSIFIGVGLIVRGVSTLSFWLLAKDIE